MAGRTWRKLGLVALILVGVSWLFLRSVRETMSEPYVVDRAALTGWRLVLTEPPQAAVALLALRPPEQLAAGLFRQIFQRTMESMTAPGAATLPVVLQREYLGRLESVLPAEEILAMARQAGLEQARLEPVCLGVKREPDAGRSRQLFFVLFETPAFDRFRQEVARLAGERGADTFEPEALQPILAVAASDPDFARWWPLAVSRTADCQAPVS